MSKQESMHWQEYGINIKIIMKMIQKKYVLFLRDGEYNNPKAREEIANVEDGYMYLLKSIGKYNAKNKIWIIQFLLRKSVVGM